MTNYNQNPFNQNPFNQNPFNMCKDMQMMDFNQINEMQKENAKAVSKAGQTVMEVTQTMMHRQSEMAKSAANNMLNMFKNTNFSNPNEMIAKQAEAMKHGMEHCVENIQEMSELMFKSASEIFNNLSKRSVECIEECVSSFNNKKATNNQNS